MTKAKTSKKQTPNSRTWRQKLKAPFVAIGRRVRGLLARRPHRSFRRSRRRDYVRSLKLPGYWAFTGRVRKMLWQNRKTFGLLALVYAVLTVVLVGVASQSIYTQLSDVLRSTSGDIFQGNWGEIGQAGLLLLAGVNGAFTETLSESQQIYAAILLLFTWLTSVWLLRALVADRKPRLRDSIYSAGSPIFATFLVGLLLVVQLLPIALAVVGYGAATASNLLAGGVEAMLFWTVALLLGTLSLYWITSTFIALVVVTLPGMYPMQAIRAAGDLVAGRRIRILLRLLWLFLQVAIVWIVVIVPIILFDTWLKGIFTSIQWLPIVPVALLLIGTLTIIWSAAYVYLLYRRIVDDDSNTSQA